MLQQARSLYGFAESKRDSIPYTFENNRRLVKILKFICDYNYSNLERRLFTYYNDIYVFFEQETFYLCLEYIIYNFSEIDGDSLENKCREMFNTYVL
jgi:hypothetical protein